MNDHSRNPGFTLVELLAALTILGLLAGLVGVAIAVSEPQPKPDAATIRVREARRTALLQRHVVTFSVTIDGVQHEATALPDGTVVADQKIDVDRLTGRRSHAR